MFYKKKLVDNQLFDRLLWLFFMPLSPRCFMLCCASRGMGVIHISIPSIALTNRLLIAALTCAGGRELCGEGMGQTKYL
jgi:hypothetical protein